MPVGSKVTTNHAEIKKWIKERGGLPAKEKASEGEAGPGLLRINFLGAGQGNFEDISWEEFFKLFEKGKFAFSCDERDDEGVLSREHAFISRDNLRNMPGYQPPE